MFELVRGGFATRRKTLRRALDAVLGDRTGARAAPRRHRSVGPGRDAHAVAVGHARARRVDRARRRSARLDAFAKLTLSLHVTGTRADGYHELDALDRLGERAARRAGAPPAAATVDRGHRTARGRRAGRRHEPGGARRARARRERRASSCTRASRPAPGSAADRPTRPRCSSGAPASPGSTPSTADVERIAADARRRRAVLPARARRDARARRRRGAGARDPARSRGRDRDAAASAARPPTCTGRGTRSAGRRARPSRSTGCRRCATTSSPPRTTCEPRLAAFKAPVEHAAGAPALLAGSGSSYAVIVRTEADGRGGAGADRRRGRRSDRGRTHRRCRRAPARERVESDRATCPADDAANGSSSEASCASSCACACGAS